jgi:hypothetical protein
MAAESRWEAEQRYAATRGLGEMWARDRARREGYAHQARYGQQQADLSLRNQMAFAQFQRQAREEDRINRLRREEMELGPRDPVMDNLIQTGSLERMFEKMAKDPQFDRDYESIMADETLRPREKYRALLEAEGQSSKRIRVQQDAMTPQQWIDQNVFLFDPASRGWPGEPALIWSNGKNGFNMGKVPQGQTFKPGWKPPPMQPGQAGPPQQPQLNGADNLISFTDAWLIAEMERYTASNLNPEDVNPGFADRYNQAIANQDAAFEALRAKTLGAGRGKTGEEIYDPDAPITMKEFDDYKDKMYKQTGEIPSPDSVIKRITVRGANVSELQEGRLIFPEAGPTPGPTPTPVQTPGTSPLLNEGERLREMRVTQLRQQMDRGEITEEQALEIMDREFPDYAE